MIKTEHSKGGEQLLNIKKTVLLQEHFFHIRNFLYKINFTFCQESYVALQKNFRHKTKLFLFLLYPESVPFIKWKKMFVFSLFCFQRWFLKYWNLTFFQRSRKRMLALTLDETYVSNEIWTRVQITILHVFACADKSQYLCTSMKMST